MLDMIQEKVAKMLKGINAGLYADDWCWNDDETVVEFTVMEFCGIKNGRPVEVNRGRYRFIYKADDVFERSAEKQVADWLEELVCRF